ncbi:MAG: TrkA family potassium uptake protein [Epsilonproteobacteria bacterium]|nr:TrkA family potassium uptake protein [Campylobacterota bacterium]
MAERNDKILLFGFGRYGEQIGLNLLSEGYNLVVADSSKEGLKKAIADKIEQVFVIDIYNDEEIADLILDHRISKVFCAFEDEERNVYLTITIKALFRNMEVIALCESKESERKLKLAGANKVIDTMYAAANRLYFILEKPAVAEAMDHILFKDPTIQFREVQVPPGSFLDGINLSQIDFKQEFNIILLGLVDKELGNRFIFVTRGINHKIDAGDILVVLGRRWDLERFEAKLKGGP